MLNAIEEEKQFNSDNKDKRLEVEEDDPNQSPIQLITLIEDRSNKKEKLCRMLLMDADPINQFKLEQLLLDISPNLELS